jgi:hypothetical protein
MSTDVITWFVAHKIVVLVNTAPIWPEIRPLPPNGFWNEDTQTWASVDVAGGGRYKSLLVVLGQNDVGQGLIYYSEI